MTLSEELEWRGFVKQTTFEDPKWLDTPRTVYFGVDPSADSLHVGNLASYMPLRHMIDKGWKVVLLIGGGTGMIGDPGGKSEERNLLDMETLASNKAAVSAQVKNLFAGKEFTLVDNYDWLSKLDLITFLRDTGKHFNMSMLVQRDYIAQRIGEGGAGISYTEFSYTLLQGYDYYHLNEELGVELQYGGSDQWGNMLSGVDLIRKKSGKESHVLAGPLIVNKRTGKKFGKSEGGAVWLDPSRTSVYQFYQFWLNSEDDDVGEYLKYFTLLTKEEIAEIMIAFEKDRASRSAQKRLAYEVTKMVHGAEKADSTAHVTEVLFGNETYDSLSEADFKVLGEALSVVKATSNSLVQLLVEGGLASSNTEARHFLQSGAVYINGQQSAADKESLDSKDVIQGYTVLRRGKNSQVLIQS